MRGSAKMERVRRRAADRASSAELPRALGVHFPALRLGAGVLQQWAPEGPSMLNVMKSVACALLLGIAATILAGPT